MKLRLDFAMNAGKSALCTALCTASLLCPLPAPALAPALEDAIVEVSETSYPILKALKPEVFGPFSEKVGKLFLDIKPEKLGKSLELGIEVFNSVPTEKLTSFTSDVKEVFAGLKTDSCTLVPLPSPAVGERFGAVATAQVDAATLKAFNDKWGPTLGALSKTESAICLPPPAALDKLSLAQAELGKSFGAVESQRFSAYTTPLLKSSITISKVLPLADDAKKLAPSATPKEKAAFQQAGKKIEGVAKVEALKEKREAQKAEFARAEAAKAAGKPVPKAAVANQAPSVAQEELAAAREAAAKEAAAKKAAQAKEAAARKQALQEAEDARIAALKAKSAAIRAGGQ